MATRTASGHFYWRFGTAQNEKRQSNRSFRTFAESVPYGRVGWSVKTDLTQECSIPCLQVTGSRISSGFQNLLDSCCPCRVSSVDEDLCSGPLWRLARLVHRIIGRFHCRLLRERTWCVGVCPLVHSDAQPIYEFSTQPAAYQCEHDCDKRQRQCAGGGHLTVRLPHQPAGNEQRHNQNVRCTMEKADSLGASISRNPCSVDETKDRSTQSPNDSRRNHPKRDPKPVRIALSQAHNIFLLAAKLPQPPSVCPSCNIVRAVRP